MHQFANVSVNDSQGEFYSKFLKSFVSGQKNFSICSYGPSGSGKSFTLGIGETYSALTQNSGIIKRILKDLFDRKATENFDIEISVAEIYKNYLFDLTRVENKFPENLSQHLKE